jgi:hypothetical protein
MRKDIIEGQPIARRTHDDAEWLDVERIARVQLTSEDPGLSDRKCPKHKS